MVKIALCVIQFSTVPECVFAKNPLAHCFRAVWVSLKSIWTLPAPMVSYSKQPAFGSIGAAQSVPDAPEIVEPHAMGSDASCHGASVDRWFYDILWFRMKKHELLGGLEHGSYDFPFILGMSSSQLTKSIIFQRGRSTTNQIVIIDILPIAMNYSH